MKNPILAAILNFLLFGAGTLYVGRRKAVGIALMIGGTMAQVIEIAVSPVGTNAIPAQWPFLLAGLLTVKLALAADGFAEAKAVSAR